MTPEQTAKSVMCVIVGHKFTTVVSSLVPYLPGALMSSVQPNKDKDRETMATFKWTACSRCGLRKNDT